ncbi:MAG: hypothetical protein AVDCRST_MAG67-3814 [uncultured Solirubrobacteraceae bacterium]|uniref:DUF305 domain-containing protein n=1 Tax=uncultured Solirubrobacteraceae bacterium TaxID=1162706 RepID=A0A6J4TGI6_9ACTN|nr:MAG: hypothetical protein AVDCRST_MAG67-3814 [uncultured Solirubrobacteraceae bacterium]
MRLISARTLPALAAAATLAVAGCGDDETSSSKSGGGGNGVDRAFVADMIPHHESAIEMAKIAQQRGESAFVKELADDISSSQSEEIATMRREDEALDAAGVKRGSLGVPDHMKGMDHDAAKLKSADPFDAAFIKMMIPHHEGAVEMAKVELAKGEDRELKALAQDIIDAQRREISEMREHLGGAASSDGGAPDEEHGSGHSG